MMAHVKALADRTTERATVTNSRRSSAAEAKLSARSVKFRLLRQLSSPRLWGAEYCECLWSDQ